MEKELSGLYPGVDVKKQLTDYYSGKILAGIKLGVIGVLIVLLVTCNQVMNGDLKEEKYLEREVIGEGEREVELDAVVGGEIIEDVMIVVGEQELPDEEQIKLVNELCKSLPDIIRGENETLDYVCMPLNLITEWKDTGINIFWSSSNYGILRGDGSFGTQEIPKQGTEVTLTAEIVFDDLLHKETIDVTIYPAKLSGQELLKEQLIESVEEREKESKTQKYFELPVTLQGEEVVWKEDIEISWLFIVGFPILVMALAMWGKDREIHKQYKERKQQLLLEYAEFVSKLRLLIGSGMSCRNAFKYLSIDYQRRKKVGGKKRFVYEEVMVMMRKLENGISEAEAFDYFSKRCDLTCYKKLVSLIIQNQKKGTEGLLDCLATEAKNSFEERRQEARRLGEEAGTKLLLPMMMMMGVVLLIIIVPAYFSFGGI